MANFTIGMVDREANMQRGCVQLVLSSDTPQKLTIKDIHFLPGSSSAEKTVILPVFLLDGEITQTIHLPDRRAAYDRLEFLLKQEGEKGWKVSVDLKADTLPVIEESPFQVL